MSGRSPVISTSTVSPRIVAICPIGALICFFSITTQPFHGVSF